MSGLSKTLTILSGYSRIKRPVLSKWLIIMIAGLMVANGCKEIKLGGMHAGEAFQDPLTAQMVHEGVRGNNSRVLELIEQGADVNAVGAEELTPLMWVIAAGHLDTAELLLQKGADPNYQMSSGESILAIAAGGDSLKRLKLLLDYGGDPSGRGKHGEPAILYAVDNHRFENLKMLVERGADVNAHDSNGHASAPRRAATLGEYAMVKYLVERGYDRDLLTLAGTVERNIISPNIPECGLRGEVLNMLYERGVRYPVNKVPPLNDPCMRQLRDDGNVHAAVIIEAAEEAEAENRRNPEKRKEEANRRFREMFGPILDAEKKK